MAYTEQEKEKWIEIGQDTGESLEKSIPLLPVEELDQTVSIPGVVFPNIQYDEQGNVVSLGKPSGFSQLPLGTLHKVLLEHQPYVGEDDYWYIWNEGTQTYVKGRYAKGEGLDYSTMTPEEYQRLVDDVRAELVFASTSTCESIIDELN